MDTAITNYLVNIDKLNNSINNYKRINAEKMIEGVIEKFSTSNHINYIGELNKTDIMF